MTPRATRPAPDESVPYYFTYISLVPDGDIVRALEAQHAAIGALVKSVPEERASAGPAPGEWSGKQILLHLIDAERLFCFRALWFARGEQSALPGMEPGPWVQLTHANSRTVDDLLAEFAHVRAASVSFFGNLDDAAWARRGIASGNPVSVRALAWIIAGHEIHHLRSLQEQYSALS
jgi:hypothetical protein